MVGGPYSDFRMSPPPHHPKEDTEKTKVANMNPPAGERPGSAVPPRPERPSETGEPGSFGGEKRKAINGARLIYSWLEKNAFLRLKKWSTF
jgi:hypothetical protein